MCCPLAPGQIPPDEDLFQKKSGNLDFLCSWAFQFLSNSREGPVSEDPSTQKSHHDSGRAFECWSSNQDEAVQERSSFERRKHMLFIGAAIADRNTAASWGEGTRNHGEKGRETAETLPESAFGWVPFGWALGQRSVNRGFLVRDCLLSRGFKRGNQSIYLHCSSPLLENGLDGPEIRYGIYGFATSSSISISTVGVNGTRVSLWRLSFLVLWVVVVAIFQFPV